jgi:protein SCO1
LRLPRRIARVAARAVLGVLWALIGCGLPAAGANRYQGEGTVLAVNPGAKTITISHREIAGLMPAMVMEFPLAHGEKLVDIEPGARITFELIAEARYVVKNVRRIPAVVLSPTGLPPTGLPTAGLAPRIDIAPLRVGEAVPDFELTDERGEAFRLSRLRGRFVALDFIYSRCPVADMCPRLSANFAYLQRHFDGRLELVSVTLDPKWDKPGVLLDYSKRWGADLSRWHFVTGEAQAIRRVAGEFGVQYWIEEDALAHSSAVGIIGPDGRLAARIDGSSYPVRQLADLISVQLGVR